MNRRLVLLLAAVSAPAVADPLPAAPHVYVQGSAEIRVEPDIVQLWIAIEATDLELAKAKATVDARARKLLESSKRLGIPDEDVSSASLLFGPDYEYRREERQFLGTKVRREIEVTLRKLDRYSDLIQAIVSAEVGEISSIELSSSKGAEVIEDAQNSALADARARAQRLAAASGQTLGAAYSISEFDQREQELYRLRPSRAVGREPHRAPHTISALGASNDVEPFEPGTIVATATVYVVYLLEAK